MRWREEGEEWEGGRGEERGEEGLGKRERGGEGLKGQRGGRGGGKEGVKKVGLRMLERVFEKA